MRPTPYVASLRVYEPLASFKPEEQVQWKDLSSAIDTKTEEQELALRRAIVSLSPTSQFDGAHILDQDGTRYVCPWSTSVRTWAAMEDLKSALPQPLTKFFISPELEDSYTENVNFSEDRVPHILSQTWTIPPRWFSLFDPKDRVRGHDSGEAFTYMRTLITHAKSRSTMAHAAVLKAFGPGFVADEIADLGEWLDMFNPTSILELDYGGLAEYVDQLLKDDGGIEADSSIEDVQSSLAGLASGDGQMAGLGYERLVTRWRLIAAFEQAS